MATKQKVYEARLVCNCNDEFGRMRFTAPDKHNAMILTIINIDILLQEGRIDPFQFDYAEVYSPEGEKIGRIDLSVLAAGAAIDFEDAFSLN